MVVFFDEPRVFAGLQEKAGFTVSQEDAPDKYKINPIVSGGLADEEGQGNLDDLFDLYFQEMQSQDYVLCKFTRVASE